MMTLVNILAHSYIFRRRAAGNVPQEIQKTYDLIRWYVPILNRLPRDQKFMLGDRMISGLYELLEELIRARCARNKLVQLEALNSQLEILRHQTRLLHDFNLIQTE